MKHLLKLLLIMAFPLIPVIAGGAALIGGIANSLSNKSAQNSANQANMELAKYQADRNLELWNLQNEYNTPSAQMARLKNAGLNPNLVYGSGQAVTTASPPPEYKAPNIQAYTGQNYGIGNAAQVGLAAYQASAQVENAQAQNANLHAQNELIKTQASAVQQKMLTETIDQAGKRTANARSEFDYNLAKKLESTSIQAAEQNVRKITADTAHVEAAVQQIQSNINRNDVLNQLTQEQMKQVRMATAKLAQDYDIGAYENALKKTGIYPGDKLWVRILGSIFKDIDSEGNPISTVTGESITKPQDWFRKIIDKIPGLGKIPAGMSNWSR